MSSPNRGGAVDLNDELFRAVERSQGFAYVSDGVGDHAPTEYFDQVRVNLKHARAVVRIIEKFLRKHGEPLT